MLSDHRAQGKPQRHWRWALNSRFLIGKPGNPMMERWRLVQTPWFGIYVHFIYREDLDPVPHDHPWRFWSLVLRGGYREEYHPDVRELVKARKRTEATQRHDAQVFAEIERAKANAVPRPRLEGASS